MTTTPETFCIHASQYDPNLHNIVSSHKGLSACTQNCGGASSSSSDWGMYRCVRLKAPDNVVGGLSVQVPSGDGLVVTFDNVTAPGKATFLNPTSTSQNLDFHYVDTTAEFAGGVTVTLSSPGINPANDPILVHMRNDDATGEVYYEDITTAVGNGTISGVAESLGMFFVIKDTTAFDPCSILTNCAASAVGPLFTDEELGSKATCSFKLDVKAPEPCPGGQTRGNWAIENGVPTPRLLATICDCYVPSWVTVDTVVGAAGAVGAARAAACAGWNAIRALGIPSVLSAMRQTQSLLDDALRIISARTREIAELVQNIDLYKASADLSKSSQESLGYLINELEGQIDDIKNLIMDQNGGLLLDADHPELIPLEQELKSLSNQLDSQFISEQNWLKQMDDAVASKASKEATIQNAEQAIKTYRANLLSDSARLAPLEGAKTMALAQIAQATGEGVVAAAAMYSFVNEISVKKTCPEGQTLNPLTCECCPPCTNGQVFPEPMSGCDCVCPKGKIPCGNFNSGFFCYDPCPDGGQRSPPGCECPSSSSSSSSTRLSCSAWPSAYFEQQSNPSKSPVPLTCACGSECQRTTFRGVGQSVFKSGYFDSSQLQWKPSYPGLLNSSGKEWKIVAEVQYYDQYQDVFSYTPLSSLCENKWYQCTKWKVNAKVFVCEGDDRVDVTSNVLENTPLTISYYDPSIPGTTTFSTSGPHYNYEYCRKKSGGGAGNAAGPYNKPSYQSGSCSDCNTRDYIPLPS